MKACEACLNPALDGPRLDCFDVACFWERLFDRLGHPYLWRFQLHVLCFKSCRSCSNPGGRRLGGRFQVKDAGDPVAEGRSGASDLGRPLFDLVGFLVTFAVQFIGPLL